MQCKWQSGITHVSLSGDQQAPASHCCFLHHPLILILWWSTSDLSCPDVPLDNIFNISLTPRWQCFQYLPHDDNIFDVSFIPSKWDLAHRNALIFWSSLTYNGMLSPSPATEDWEIKKIGTSSKSDLWQAVCFRAFPFHLMKIAIFGKKITLNCWRNLLFYTRYNMGWWPGWGIWRFFGWEFMKLYYRVALLLLRMCWPSTDRAKGWNIRTNAAPAIWFDLICERLNNGWAQCRLLPIHQIWNSGNMRFKVNLPICSIAVFPVHWSWLRREDCPRQSSAKISPKFYSNQEYCTLTGFQLFCLIPNNWDW